MSTYNVPKLLVGNYLSEVFKTGKHFDGDRYQLIDNLEDQGMYYMEGCDWVGFEVEEDVTILPLNMFTMNKVSNKARQFELITGVPAKIKACVFSY